MVRRDLQPARVHPVLVVGAVNVGVGASVAVRGGEHPTVGRITAVLPSVDPLTRRVLIEAQIKNEKDPLLAGTFVRAVIEGGAPIAVLRIPVVALRPGSQDEVVLVEEGKLVLRRVAFARAEGGFLLVRAGLDAGAAVVALPSAEMRAGEAVVVEKAKE